MGNLLEIRHLYKKVGDFALKDINLTLPPGYIMSLLGVNGSGKTTLLNSILNLYRRDAGEVLIDGIEIGTEERKAKDRIGFVLDENMFEDSLSVLENAGSFGRLYSRYDEELFKIFCDKFGVPLHKKLGNLSAGMDVRFQLAFALSHDAVLFIMDEPAAGLDPLFRKELMGCMQEIVEDGARSVLFSTHIMEDLENISDYITLMRKGTVFAEMAAPDLKARYRLLYGDRKQIEELPFSHILYREYGAYGSYAFLECTEGEDYGSYETKEPRLQDILYCLEKGGYGDVPDHA